MASPDDTPEQKGANSTESQSQMSRRSIMQATGGLVGLTALSGLSVAQTTTETPGQQPSDKQIGMITTANGQNFYTVPFRWVEPGTTVRWELIQGSHSTTAYAEMNNKPNRIPAEASAWDSGVKSEPGTTFERTFDVPGVYDYYCTPHEGLGMVGRLVVGSPNLETQPALAEPQDSLPSSVSEALSGLNVATRVIFGRGISINTQ